MQNKYDFLIIGAGISGFSSALLLAQFGYRVAILEQAPQPAPLISGFSRSGFYFETGFHYTGGAAENDPVDCNLKALGVAGRVEKIQLDQTAFDTVRFADSDFQFSFPQGYDHLVEKLSQSFPDQRRTIAAYLDEVKKTAASLPYYELDGPAAFPGLAILHGDSLARVLDRFEINGRLRTLLELHCLLHGADATEIPFLVHAGVVDSYYRSAHTFRGGGRALARALTETAQSLGIDIFCRTEVEKITLSPAGTLTGAICRNGNFFAASNCILTAHPYSLLQLLPETTWRPAFRRRLAGLEETIGGELIFLSSPKSKRFNGRNFYFIPPQNVPLLNTDRAIDQRLLYLNFAPGNHQAGGITAILPGILYDPELEFFSAPEYERRKQRLGEKVRKQIIELLPELGCGLKVEATATAKTLQTANASRKGSMYGIKHKLDQFNPSPLTRVRGLYLSGQAVAAPGLLGATISAFMTVGEVVGHQPLKKFRREKICDA